LYHSLLDIGPEFKVTGQIDASLEVSDIEATVGLNYDLCGVTFAFPPQDNSQAGSFTPGMSRESPACLSFGPHLMSLVAAPRSVNAPSTNRQLIDRDTVEVTASTNPDVGLTFEATGHLIPQFDIGLSAFGGTVSSTVFVNLDASADFTIATSTADITQACASASTILNVGVGAEAAFFSLFDASVGETLFNETFPLLEVGMTTSVLSSAQAE